MKELIEQLISSLDAEEDSDLLKSLCVKYGSLIENEKPLLYDEFTVRNRASAVSAYHKIIDHFIPLLSQPIKIQKARRIYAEQYDCDTCKYRSDDVHVGQYGTSVYSSASDIDICKSCIKKSGRIYDIIRNYDNKTKESAYACVTVDMIMQKMIIGKINKKLKTILK